VGVGGRGMQARLKYPTLRQAGGDAHARDQPRRLLGWALDCLDFEVGLDCGGFAAEGGLGCCTSDEGSERGTSVCTSQPGSGETMRLGLLLHPPGVRPRSQPGASRSPAPPRVDRALPEPCVKGPREGRGRF
jgi:hypothetical protein